MFKPHPVRIAGGRGAGELTKGLKKGGFSHAALPEKFIHADVPCGIVMYAGDGPAQPQLGVVVGGGPVEFQMNLQKNGLQQQILLPPAQIDSASVDGVNGTEQFHDPAAVLKPEAVGELREGGIGIEMDGIENQAVAVIRFHIVQKTGTKVQEAPRTERMDAAFDPCLSPPGQHENEFMVWNGTRLDFPAGPCFPAHEIGQGNRKIFYHGILLISLNLPHPFRFVNKEKWNFIQVMWIPACTCPPCCVIVEKNEGGIGNDLET